MKALKVLAIVFAVITLLLTFAPILRDLSLATEISDLQAEGGLMATLVEVADLPSPGVLFAGMFVAILLTVGCIVGIVFAIKNNPKLFMLSIVLFVLTILTIVIHPSFTMGFAAASPREVAIFHAIPAAITTLFLFLYGRRINSGVQN